MLWRHLSLVQAWSAAGLMTCSLAATAWAEPGEAPPTDATTGRAVSVLDARKAGDLKIEARGSGQDRVKITLTNKSAQRLKVVLPPGLVASSAVAQGRGGGGGGFQSMGLGAVSNRPGTFGAFRGADSGDTGFRSVGVAVTDPADAVAIPAGKSVDLTVTSVCLNFGVRTPNGRDSFELVDVEDYTNDPRARKALRSLATYGTSQGVAQAVMWQVCNGVPFPVMAEQATKVMNGHEIALASRFVAALDSSGAGDLVDPAYLTGNRVFVRIVGDGPLANEANRLSRELDGLRVLGLPVRVVDGEDAREAAAPALFLNVVLASSHAGETKGRIVVNVSHEGRWVPLGKTSFVEASAASVLDGAGLVRTVERSVATTFVSVKTSKKGHDATTVKVENRLPFTLANVTLKAGTSAGAAPVAFPGLGVSPGRSAMVPVQAPSAVVERVELNGL
jgi:hypothetical protein